MLQVASFEKPTTDPRPAKHRAHRVVGTRESFKFSRLRNPSLTLRGTPCARSIMADKMQQREGGWEAMWMSQSFMWDLWEDLDAESDVSNTFYGTKHLLIFFSDTPSQSDWTLSLNLEKHIKQDWTRLYSCICGDDPVSTLCSLPALSLTPKRTHYEWLSSSFQLS